MEFFLFRRENPHESFCRDKYSAGTGTQFLSKAKFGKLIVRRREGQSLLGRREKYSEEVIGCQDSVCKFWNPVYCAPHYDLA